MMRCRTLIPAIVAMVLASSPAAMFQVDIESAMAETDCPLSRSTIGTRLRKNLDAGRVEQPHGDRGGWAITERGLAALRP